MCGLAGILGNPSVGSVRAIDRMCNALTHRGPDDVGSWRDLESSIALGHRRLSVLDLSAAGHQPMVSHSGRYVLAFNGEIYNHLALREELEQGDVIPWRGHSDTETLLAACEAWGLRRTLQRAVGMFALALWDRQERRLYLARDRMGEKPLYFGWSGGAFLFGSELKALCSYPGFEANIDRDVLATYLRYAYVPAPYSIYRGVYKLPPGCIMQVGVAAAAPSSAPMANSQGAGWRIDPYWSLLEHASLVSDPFPDDVAALSQLEHTLQQAVHAQQLSDVPLGAFLSGGVDSSLIVALMQAQSSRPVRTFTIGFAEAGYSEADNARAVAAHLGTDHTELRVTPQQALDVIPHVPDIYDEPFADSSQIPTYLVAQLARQHVTVALSGDAGDELFGGYNRYTWAPRIARQSGRLPAWLRSPVGAAVSGLSRFVPGGGALENSLGHHVAQAGEKLQKLGPRLAMAANPAQLYQGLVSQWLRPGDIVRVATELPTLPLRASDWPDLGSFEAQMMYLDAMTYLPDDILCKVDRAAMAVSLETRVPMLDHRVVEFAWRLPLNMKIRDGQGKWALRQVLDRYVPRNLIDRPKQGFAIPLGEWLRGPLRDWAESLLQPALIQQQGYFQVAPVREKWAQHLSGKRNWEHALWPVLMFQAWLQHQGEVN